MPTALITMAGGIGDLVRTTPLIRVCGALGYAVDLLISADYPGASALFREAPEVRRELSSMDGETYDVAVCTALSSLSSTRRRVRARRVLAFDRREWLANGDLACIETLSTQLGWSGALPPPFVVPSARQFDLAPGTVALHPGCKPNWPWKKWHGFDALARRLPRVVLVGTPADVENRGTYFKTAFTWPPHARSFIGRLDLADTAALLSECAALVSNDSGLMHVGAALGIPTIGIFGITSPAREAIPVPNMLPVSKGLACEPACRRGSWGRRDCEFHLECLRTLTPDDVLERMRTVAPHAAEPEPCSAARG
jgi:ADP-heptose:LPS heptosyltransferase